MTPNALQRYPATPAASDTVDVADVVRTLSRQWRAVIAFVVLGVIAAAAIVLFAPRRFDGKATVLARGGSGGGASVVGRITGIGELMGGLASGALGGGIETELQVLRSRLLAGQVVDSLRLQFRVREPAGLAPFRLVETASLQPSFEPRKYHFERNSDGRYQANLGDRTLLLTPGQPGALDIGTVTLRKDSLPASFTILVLDREDAIEKFSTRMQATKSGGEIAKVVYRADDSLTAGLVPNLLIDYYLERRRTTDRGANARKVEYVSAQLDSTARELAATEAALRHQQEDSRVPMDAEIVGKVEVENAGDLRRALTDLQVEEASVNQLLAAADAGRISVRELTAYPTFLKGSSVSPLAAQLTDLEAKRIQLLERRTERDPEVVAIDSSMRAIEANILGTVRTYASSVTRQREEMQRRVDGAQATLMALPAAAERGGRLKRDVERLTTIYTALQAQLVEARLAAIGEGGDLKQIDVSVPPRSPAFPKPLLTMGLGTAGGLVAGMVAALFMGWFGRWLRDPIEIERALGVTAQRFDPAAPLIMAGTPSASTVLVVPLDARARAGSVVERLARTAQQRGVTATVLDLSAPHAGNGNGAGNAPAAAIDALEREQATVIVQLPVITSDTTIAALNERRPVLLVAAPGPVNRAQLSHAVSVLRYLQAPCAGVVISDGAPRLSKLSPLQALG